jgi:hypothetical protein
MSVMQEGKEVNGCLLCSCCNRSTWVDAVWRDLSRSALLVPLRLGDVVDVDNVHLRLSSVSKPLIPLDLSNSQRCHYHPQSIQ